MLLLVESRSILMFSSVSVTLFRKFSEPAIQNNIKPNSNNKRSITTRDPPTSPLTVAGSEGRTGRSSARQSRSGGEQSIATEHHGACRMSEAVNNIMAVIAEVWKY